ncbi:hypothetical protein [Klebsiella michiganensis]|uniref:hypothetical protein n=1 Tax=Klebsiella michiganensis TaxID=1134687 RepID=UPI003F8E35E8
MTSKLTIEQARRLRNDFECWQQDYDPKDDKEQYDMFGRGMVAMDMLIAGMYQEPVAYMWDSKRNDIDAPGFYFPEHLFFAESNVKQWGGEVIPLYRHVQQPLVRPAPECEHQWRHGGANKLQNQKQCIKCGRVELDSQRAPVLPDERAAFNAWNNDIDCPLAGRDAKSAAWLAWNYRAMLQSGNSPVIPDGSAVAANTGIPMIPDGYVMVPMRLTAENGAKGVLSGEFSEIQFVNCPECFGDDECETCDGSGRIEITVPVTWTTIKDIWAKGVEHFAAAPQEVKGE